MKWLVVLLVSMFCLGLGAASYAQPRRHHAGATKKTKKRRARTPPRRSTPLATQCDEIVLSTPQLKQLQRNLVAGGYLRGTADGRLSPRTRHAIAEFQREYHLVGTGAVDRPSAETLLGSDAVGGERVAAAANQ